MDTMSPGVLLHSSVVMKHIHKHFILQLHESHTWGEILNLYLDVIERYTGKKAKLLILDKHPYQRDNRPFYQLIYDRYFNRTFDNTKIGKIRRR